MYPKFIITLDGTLKFGNVYLHRELLPKGHTTCHGGGLWKIVQLSDAQKVNLAKSSDSGTSADTTSISETSCIILYGRSFDFGLPEFEYLQRVDNEGPGSLGLPIFYQRRFADEEFLEPVWPRI